MIFPKVIAHRGLPHAAPENTMASFKEALRLGVDGIETDVQQTKDGQLVICHDELINRTTNGTGLLKDYTLNELKKLSAGVWFDKKFISETIPTLRQFFDLVHDKDILINLEIKSGVVLYPDIEKHIIDMIHEYNIGSKIIISSFNHYSLVTCKEIDNSINTGILYECGLFEPWNYARSVGAEALHPSLYNIKPELMQGIKENNLKVNPYTVDSLEQMKYMVAMQVDGIITNYSDRLIALKKEWLEKNEA